MVARSPLPTRLAGPPLPDIAPLPGWYRKPGCTSCHRPRLTRIVPGGNLDADYLKALPRTVRREPTRAGGGRFDGRPSMVLSSTRTLLTPPHVWLPMGSPWAPDVRGA